MKSNVCMLVLLLGGAALCAAQPATPDLTKFADSAVWRVHNRATTGLPDRVNSLHLDARKGDGVAWLVGSDFAEGTIEVDLRGADQPGQSFVGVALRGVDDATFDAVYFRAFNFKHGDPIRRAHAVQYISLPEHHWQALREKHPGKYEAAVKPAPEPNDWFHARIVVQNRLIRVYVNDATEPSLTVTELSDRRHGRIGLWVGNASAGDFANLKIIPPAP